MDEIFIQRSIETAARVRHCAPDNETIINCFNVEARSLEIGMQMSCLESY